jgi:hypothetical protein
MPETAFFGKDGTVLSIGGVNYLGSFKTCRGSVATREADHSGPQDKEEYATITKKRLTLTIEAFTPASGGASALDLVGKRVTVSANTIDGRTLAGTFNVTDAEASSGEEAGSESLTCKSVGAWTLT